DDMYKRFNVDRGRKDHWAMYPAPATIKVVFEPVEGDAGDLKKGIKPSARVVAQTVLGRPTPSPLSKSSQQTRGRLEINMPPPPGPAGAVEGPRTRTLEALNDAETEGPGPLGGSSDGPTIGNGKTFQAGSFGV